MSQSAGLLKSPRLFWQRGQAMVEYAILLIVLVMIVVGGAELGISAFHASKTGDGAEAAANQWAHAAAFNNGILLSYLTPRNGESPEDGARHLQVIDALGLRDDEIKKPDCSDPGDPTELTSEDFSLSLELCDLNNLAHQSHLFSKLDDISENPIVDFSLVCIDLGDIVDPDDDRVVNCINAPKKFLVRKPLLIDWNGTLRQVLGDHNPANFRHPNCDGATYDNGLPDDGKIYLFNPLPIDMTNCDGSDSKKVGELVGGTADYEGLPKLNQAIYSQYTKVCVDYSGGVITIQPLDSCVENEFRLWLKPPGKMCGAGTDPSAEYCPGQGDLQGATGYYFFGDGNVSEERLKYTPGSASDPEFRPSFQLVCEGADFRDESFDALNSLGNPACANLGNGSFSLQVHTRYRAIYESFLTFGVQELTDIGLLDYFYNPNKVGFGDSNQLVGTAGSEIGSKDKNNNPTVKYFRDFRGCYRVDITPPDKIGEQIKTAVSSCN